MAIQDTILQGSYKGFSFQTYGTELTKPKKNDINRYPNTAKRIIESLGVEDEVFNMTMVIYGGEQHKELRERFQALLNEEDEGTLIHPLDGEFTVKCTNWKRTDNIQTELGKATYTATFYVTNPSDNANPVEVENSGIKLLNATLETNEDLAASTNETVVISSSLNYGVVEGKLNAFSEIAAVNGGLIEDETDAATFSRTVQSFDNNTSTLLTNPETMGTSISDIFADIETFITDAPTRFNSIQSFFNFGSSDSIINRNTAERIERDNNNQVLNTQMQLNSLNIAYNAVSEIEYNNDSDLKEAEQIVNAQIEQVLNSDIFNNTSIFLVDEIYNQAVAAKVEIAKVFKDKTQVTPAIVSISPQNASIALLNYQYYNSLDKYDEIANLNPDKDQFYIISEQTNILSDTV